MCLKREKVQSKSKQEGRREVSLVSEVVYKKKIVKGKQESHPKPRFAVLLFTGP